MPEFNLETLYAEIHKYKQLQQENTARLKRIGTLILMYKLAGIKPPAQTVFALKRLQQEQNLLLAKPIVLDELEAKIERYKNYGTENLLEEIQKTHESIKDVLKNINTLEKELKGLEATIDNQELNIDGLIADLIPTSEEKLETSRHKPDMNETEDTESVEKESQSQQEIRPPLVNQELLNIVLNLPKSYEQDMSDLAEHDVEYYLIKPNILPKDKQKHVRITLFDYDRDAYPIMTNLEYNVPYVSYLSILETSQTQKQSLFTDLQEETYEQIKQRLLEKAMQAYRQKLTQIINDGGKNGNMS